MAGVRGKMSGLRHLISFDEATSRLRKGAWKGIGTEIIEVNDSLDRVIAENIKADVDVPTFDRSAVDGFAVMHRSVSDASSEAPVRLKLAGKSGFESTGSMHYGEASEINTGGRIPGGSDAVIMAEYVTREGGYILVEQPARIWENVSRKGEDIQAGSRIISRGDQIRPWHIAALISVGVERVKVFEKIRMGVMSTGSEIYPGSASSVRNTTQPLIINYFRSSSVDTRNEGVQPDDREAIKAGVEGALCRSDILVVTGGSSIGPHDVTAEVLDSLGKEIFRGVLIKPGRTISLYNIEGIPAFSVSGLPVAALTSFEAFFEAFRHEVLGFADNSVTIKARLTGRVINSIGMRSYVRLALSRTSDSLDATPLRNTGSGILSSLMESNGLTVVPEHLEGIETGEYVWVTVKGGPV